MGVVDPVPAEQTTERPDGGSLDARKRVESRLACRHDLIIVAIAAIIFLTGLLSPPSLMDDVDAAQSQIARTMLQSGDWVTAHLDGVVYLEKAPLKYWMTAISFAIFGVHDWAARIPVALCTILLCWVVARFGRWAFSAKAGFYAGLVNATCVGLFLFTRVVIPDVMITLAVAVAIWSFLRALDEGEAHPRRWSWLLAVALAAGVLLKGLIGIVFPLGAAFLYLLFTRQLFSGRTWKRLYPLSSAAIFLILAAPWHILATLRNPPYFDFTMHSGPGVWRGFFWFYFINEHVLRFLNARYPRDYDTVPRLWFWLFHAVWLFPWSVYLPGIAKLGYRPADRGGRTRLMALCLIGVVMAFFSVSTTQEYYSMPIYPAVALLIGCVMAGEESHLVRNGTRVVAAIAGIAAVLLFTVLGMARNLPAPGDISRALTSNPQAYTLSLGHMEDLTLRAFAYLKLPLAIAGAAFLVGSIGGWILRGRRAFLALAAMMVIFYQAARLALITFDPYLSSRPLAEALKQAPRGQLIIDDEYYTFSSIFFYTDHNALILNGRRNNLEYGSYAPNAPEVFINEADFIRLWNGPRRCYAAADSKGLANLTALAGAGALYTLAEAGGKTLVSNQPVGAAAMLPSRNARRY